MCLFRSPLKHVSKFIGIVIGSAPERGSVLLVSGPDGQPSVLRGAPELQEIKRGNSDSSVPPDRARSNLLALLDAPTVDLVEDSNRRGAVVVRLGRLRTLMCLCTIDPGALHSGTIRGKYSPATPAARSRKSDLDCQVSYESIRECRAEARG